VIGLFKTYVARNSPEVIESGELHIAFPDDAQL